MNTQMKLLAASCALVAANAAHALSPTIVPDYSMFMSGSSALQADLTNEIGGTLCQAGTVDMYLDAGGGNDFRMYTCTTSASAGVTAGKNLVVYLRANGGSFYGTAPVGNFAIGRYDPIGSVAGQVAGGCPASAPVVLGPTITGGANCSGWTTANAAALVKQIPDAGIADVEPALVTNVANAPTSCTGLGDTACAPAAVANYTVNPVLIQAFGVIASGPMQTALINAGATGGGKANMQDRWLTDAFAVSSGVYNNGDWNALSDLVTSSTGSTNAFSGSVVLCRRAKGSGTQASFQARYMNVGCANSGTAVQTVAGLADSLAVIANPSLIPATGAYNVYENSSSGAVITCVQQASSAGLKALGLLSLDQQSSSKFNRGTANGQIDFIAINGQAPNDATIANGSYPYMVESTVQVDSRTAGQNANGVLVANAMVKAMQTVTTQSPYGVYNILTGVQGAVTGTAAPKAVKGANNSNTCRPFLF